MRVASVIAVAAAAVRSCWLSRAPPTRSSGASIAAQTERITIIDENGRARTSITVRPRSYLDGGTEVLPGERKFMDYAYTADLHGRLADRRMGPERHSSFPAADAVRAAGLQPVSNLLIGQAPQASHRPTPPASPLRAMIASPIAAVPTVVVPADAMSAVRRPFASAAAIAASIMSASFIIPNE